MNLDVRSKQTRFLSACAVSGKTLGEVLEELQVSPATLARWLTQRSFRQRVNRLRKSLALSRELQLAVGAARAAQVLAGGLRTPADCNHRACVELIRLSRDTKARRRAEERPAKPSINPAGHSLPVHPDLNRNEAQKLIDDLQRTNP